MQFIQSLVPHVLILLRWRWLSYSAAVTVSLCLCVSVTVSLWLSLYWNGHNGSYCAKTPVLSCKVISSPHSFTFTSFCHLYFNLLFHVDRTVQSVLNETKDLTEWLTWVESNPFLPFRNRRSVAGILLGWTTRHLPAYPAVMSSNTVREGEGWAPHAFLGAVNQLHCLLRRAVVWLLIASEWARG